MRRHSESFQYTGGGNYKEKHTKVELAGSINEQMNMKRRLSKGLTTTGHDTLVAFDRILAIGKRREGLV